MYINYFQCAISLNLVDIHEFFYTPRKKKKQKNKEIYMGDFIMDIGLMDDCFFFKNKTCRGVFAVSLPTVADFRRVS